jgi:hypothetical protein
VLSQVFEVVFTACCSSSLDASRLRVLLNGFAFLFVVVIQVLCDVFAVLCVLKNCAIRLVVAVFKDGLWVLHKFVLNGFGELVQVVNSLVSDWDAEAKTTSLQVAPPLSLGNDRHFNFPVKVP